MTLSPSGSAHDESAQRCLASAYGTIPWGNAQPGFEEIGKLLRYTGRKLDDLTGLYQYRARWYDPELARFISQDPIGLAGGINPYEYAAGDPVNLRDPSGLNPDCDNSNTRTFELCPVIVRARPRQPFFVDIGNFIRGWTDVSLWTGEWAAGRGPVSRDLEGSSVPRPQYESFPGCPRRQ